MGGSPPLLRGASGYKRFPSPGCPSLGRVAGARCPCLLGVGGADVGTRHRAGACALARQCCALRGWRVVALVGTPLAVLSGLSCQAFPLPQLPVLRADSRGLVPVSSGRGRCGCGEPALTPQLALLRGGIACCWNGRGASPGGFPRAFMTGACC